MSKFTDINPWDLCNNDPDLRIVGSDDTSQALVSIAHMLYRLGVTLDDRLETITESLDEIAGDLDEIMTNFVE